MQAHVRELLFGHPMDDEVQPPLLHVVIDRRQEPQLKLRDAPPHDILALWVAPEIAKPIELCTVCEVLRLLGDRQYAAMTGRACGSPSEGF